MPETIRVSPKYVRDRLLSGEDTLLVCAYDDEAKHRECDLEGSIGLSEFESNPSTIGKEREVVFYCS
jgi:hypothetical protein